MALRLIHFGIILTPSLTAPGLHFTIYLDGVWLCSVQITDTCNQLLILLNSPVASVISTVFIGYTQR